MSTTVLVCADLIFRTKISGTAKSLDGEVNCVASIAAAKEIVDSSTARVIVDLDLPASEAELTQLRRQMSPSATAIAYGPHVNVERLKEARNAGWDVLPRSEFASKLTEILSD